MLVMLLLCLKCVKMSVDVDLNLKMIVGMVFDNGWFVVFYVECFE